MTGKTERALAETMGHPEKHSGGKKKGGGDEKVGRLRARALGVRRRSWNFVV